MSTFPKERRIKKNYDFKKVYSEGEKTVGKYFVIYTLDRQKTPTGKVLKSRLGLSISKKIDKRATVRNRIKRLFRESFRNNTNIADLGYDIIIVFRKKVVTLTYSQLDAILTTTLEKKILQRCD